MSCPARANFCENQKSTEARPLSFFHEGTVEGMTVDDILQDTGCTRTLVHHKLLPIDKVTKGSIVTRCANGDEVAYPLTEVDINIDGKPILVEAGVS